jgi:hypothetical protein
MQEWYKVQQETEETFKEYVSRITKLRTVINSMFLPLLGHEKIDDSDMLTKIKTLNPYYMKMMSQNIITMETKRKKYGLQEWITNLECVESQHDIINPQEKTERVNMARTTTPLPVQPGTNFRATVNAAQAKQEWLCNNWNGEPGSCKYGQHCRFKHTNDKVVRRAHLKKVQEWQATQKAKADESKKKKNEDKSAKETAKKAAAQASGGAAAKDYVEIARAMLVAMKDLGAPSKAPSKSVSWLETDKGKRIEEKREREGGEREREKGEERERKWNDGKRERNREKKRRGEEGKEEDCG